MKKILCGLAILSLCAPAAAHDWYTHTVNQKGWPCCDKDDFKPVRAWIDESDGKWHAIYPFADGTSKEFVVEEWMMVDDKFNKEPFTAHLAVYHGEARCFMRKATGG